MSQLLDQHGPGNVQAVLDVVVQEGQARLFGQVHVLQQLDEEHGVVVGQHGQHQEQRVVGMHLEVADKIFEEVLALLHEQVGLQREQHVLHLARHGLVLGRTQLSSV